MKRYTAEKIFQHLRTVEIKRVKGAHLEQAAKAAAAKSRLQDWIEFSFHSILTANCLSVMRFRAV